MSRWRSESVLITRYLGGGALNTIVGFSLIFVLMGFGVSPLLANISGYLVGFVLGFVVSKRFIFCSNGHLVLETTRYLFAFAISFFANVLVLQWSLNYLELHAIASQVMAAISYTILMYFLMRYFVFDVNFSNKSVLKK